MIKGFVDAVKVLREKGIKVERSPLDGSNGAFYKVYEATGTHDAPAWLLPCTVIAFAKGLK